MDKHKCEGRKWNGWEYYPCIANGKVQHDGKWYCGIHDPVAKAAKDKVKRELVTKQIELARHQHQAEEDARKLQEAKAAMFDELVAACRLAYDENHCTPDCDKVLTAVLAKAKEIQNGQQ